MRERPFLFNGAMVRAILAGQKTQTRRVMKQQPADDIAPATFPNRSVQGWRSSLPHPHGPTTAHFCPFGQAGDRLWVRETWQHYDWTDDGEPCIRYQADGATEWPEDYSEQEGLRLNDVWAALSDDANFAIDGRAADHRWRPSVHMPRWACRLVLEITAVRVERLQAISAEDAVAEGIPSLNDDPRITQQHFDYTSVEAGRFRDLWTSTGGDWDSNPWVWVIEFIRVKVAGG